MGLKKRTWNWNKIEQEFYEGAERAISALAQNGTLSSITFWSHVEYMPVHIYTEEQYGGSGAFSFTVPTLAKNYNSDHAMGYSEIGENLVTHFGHACQRLKENKIFDPLVDDQLSVWIETAATKRKKICTVGNSSKIDSVFAMEDLSFDLTATRSATTKEKWWFASCASLAPEKLELQPQFHEVLSDRGDSVMSWQGESLAKHKDLRFKANIQSTRQLSDWMYANAYEVWSYKLCALMKELGVTNIEYYPIQVTHEDLQETSDLFYQLAIVVGTNENVILVTEDDTELHDWEPFFEKEFLRGKKQLLDNTSLKVFRVDRVENYGLVIDNTVKTALEANQITGIDFFEIPFWNCNELELLRLRHTGGDLRASVRLARMKLFGLGIPKEEEQAKEIIDTIIDAGDTKAFQELMYDTMSSHYLWKEYRGSGWYYYLLGVEKHFDQDEQLATIQLEKAIQLGSHRAKRLLKKMQTE